MPPADKRRKQEADMHRRVEDYDAFEKVSPVRL